MREYPKMIYKGNIVSPVVGEYFVADCYEKEMEMKEIWGDKRPDAVAKAVKSMDNESKVVENSDSKAEVKPRRRKAAKKAHFLEG